jgi:hypothetical protein
VEKAFAEFGRIDVIVSNAGYAGSPLGTDNSTTYRSGTGT